MSNLTVTVNTPVSIYFSGTAAQTSFGDFKLLKNGIITTTPTIVISELSTGFYSLTWTPTSTGNYGIYIAGAFRDYVEVVSKSIYTYLRNIEDEAIGSWSWDKTTGVLSLVRQDGTDFVSFNVEDTQVHATKELI